MAAASRSDGSTLFRPGQVEDHDVADVPPARRHQHRPQVEVRVAEPVDQVALLGAAEQVVEQALLRRVDELPDEADDRQRQHHRQVQGALVDAGRPELLVELEGQEQPEGGRDQQEEHQPDEVVLHRRPERRVDGEDLPVVLQPDPLDGVQAADAVPAGERQRHRQHGRHPDEGEVEQGRDGDHHRQDELVPPGEPGAAPTAPGGDGHG